MASTPDPSRKPTKQLKSTAPPAPPQSPTAPTIDLAAQDSHPILSPGYLGEDLNEATWRLTLARWGLGRHDLLRSQWPRQLAILAASVATLVYLSYRVVWTLNLQTTSSTVFSIALVAAEMYAGLSLGLYFYQVWRLVEPPLLRPTPGRSVDVFVTTYNEDASLLRGTLLACRDMDYPHTTYILDDGAREEIRQLAEDLGVQYISRTERTHAKAGNLNHALEHTRGEFIIVLDADHIPARHFIARLIGYFDDPRMGFVQVPHTTYNLDNFLGDWQRRSKAYWEDVRIFFEAVQLGKNRRQLACFCGSAAMFRRQAIEDVGRFATETITEDMHTGMRIHAAGWKSVAVSEEMVVGLAPDDAATFATQRLRWGEGNLSVLAYDNPLTMKGLSLAGRINYVASIASWTLGPARLVLYLTPLVMLLTGVTPVADMSVRYFAVVGVYLLTVWTAVKVASNGCGQLLGIELAMMASFHLQLQSLWRALFRRRRQKFVVTPKRRSQSPSGLGRMWPQAALVAASIVAISWGASRIIFGLSNDYFGLAIGGGLASYHACLAMVMLRRTLSQRGSEEAWRHPLCLAVDYAIGGQVEAGASIEFNELGCRLLTWKPLEPGTPLELTYYSPVGQTVCSGRVATSTPLGRRDSFAYTNDILFENDDPSRREQQTDALRRLIFDYVVPINIMEHRLVSQGGRTLPAALRAEADLPLPALFAPQTPGAGTQKAVAWSVNPQGFVAALGVPCPIGIDVTVTLSTPLGTTTADAVVEEVKTIRAGATIIYQHKFRWRDGALLKPVLRSKRPWRTAFHRAVGRWRARRQPLGGLLAMELAAALLVALTVYTFGQVRHRDMVLAMAARQPVAPSQLSEVKEAISHLFESSNASVDRLLRLHDAATRIGDQPRAAETAARLAVAVPSNRPAWILDAARHSAQADDPAAAEAAFERVLAEPFDRKWSNEEQSRIYVEAARAAVAVRDYPKAVERFLKASDLTTLDARTVEEFLGVLITAKETKLALLVLGHLDRSDRVLRHIVAIHAAAGEPELALAELQELHRRHPEDAKVLQMLAELAVTRQDFAEAMRCYQAMVKLRPNDENVREKLAEIMVLLAREEIARGRHGGACQLFDAAIRLYPPDVSVLREYAGVLVQAGHLGPGRCRSGTAPGRRVESPTGLDPGDAGEIPQSAPPSARSRSRPRAAGRWPADPRADARGRAAISRGDGKARSPAG